MAYKIVTDNSSDMNLDFIKESDMVVIPMKTTMDGEEVMLLTSDIENVNSYYELMLEDKPVSSSQVNRADFEKYFTQVLDDGYDIIYTGLSSGLSGTYDNAVEVAKELREKSPERKIAVLNTVTACTGAGLLVQTMQELKNQGMTYEELVEWVDKYYMNVVAQFGVDDLKYLYRGGRVSRTTAGVGNLLQVKPMLHIKEDGSLDVVALDRGRKNNMKHLLKNFRKNWLPEISDMVVIGYAYYKENALALKEMVEEEFPQARIYIAPIGTLIGTHVGPGMWSLCYFGKER